MMASSMHQEISMNGHPTNYGVDDGDGNQITVGLQGHDHAREIAQRHADRRGALVVLYEMGRNEDDIDESKSEEIEPSDDVKVTATIGTPSTCLDEDSVGWDFDVEVSIGEHVIVGSATLVPDRDERQGGRLVSFGGDVSAWLSGELADYCRKRTDRAVERAIESACQDIGTSAPQGNV